MKNICRLPFLAACILTPLALSACDTEPFFSTTTEPFEVSFAPAVDNEIIAVASADENVLCPGENNPFTYTRMFLTLTTTDEDDVELLAMSARRNTGDPLPDDAQFVGTGVREWEFDLTGTETPAATGCPIGFVFSFAHDLATPIAGELQASIEGDSSVNIDAGFVSLRLEEL